GALIKVANISKYLKDQNPALYKHPDVQGALQAVLNSSSGSKVPEITSEAPANLTSKGSVPAVVNSLNEKEIYFQGLAKKHGLELAATSDEGVFPYEQRTNFLSDIRENNPQSLIDAVYFLYNKTGTLEGAYLPRANLREIDLKNMNLQGSDMSGANFSSSNLSSANLIASSLEQAKFDHAKLLNADLTNAWMEKASLFEANLERSVLENTNLVGANLRGANLREANMVWANLSGADLRMANLTKANLEQAKFDHAKLLNADLTKARMGKSSLFEANLERSVLENTYLVGANLRGANLREANMVWANLSGADLMGADLMGADLRMANLTNANLTGANLKGANLERAIFLDADLSNIIIDKNVKSQLLATQLPRVENLAQEEWGVKLPGGGVQSMSFQHLPETTKKVLNILLNPEELKKQFTNPRSELSILMPELLKYAPEHIAKELQAGLPYNGIEASGPYQHSYHKYQNLLQHTLKVIQTVQASKVYLSASREQKIILTLAALSHDLGKPTTMRKGQARVDDSHGDVSKKLAYQIADRLDLAYPMGRQIAELVGLKEELTKLTEVNNFSLPSSEKLHQLAAKIGSEKFLDMIWALGESDSFRVRDNLIYWNRYAKNRKVLTQALKPLIRLYEHLNYPLINDARRLLSQPSQRLYFKNESGGNFQVPVIDLRGKNDSYFVHSHVTDFDNFRRSPVEDNALLSSSYSELNGGLDRSFLYRNTSLVIETTPNVVAIESIHSGRKKNTYNIINHKEKLGFSRTSWLKFQFIQDEFINKSDRLDNNDIIQYFYDGDNSISGHKSEENLKFQGTIQKIEEINRQLNHLQNYGRVPEGVSKEHEEKLKSTMTRLSYFVAHFDDVEKVIQSNYQINYQIDPKMPPLKNNEILGFQVEVAAVRIKLPEGSSGSVKELLTPQYRKELNFAAKYNIPVVIHE
ncbi:MAG: pentapeptide repeat-containing protein, partial [Burkholderiales bacterium]